MAAAARAIATVRIVRSSTTRSPNRWSGRSASTSSPAGDRRGGPDDLVGQAAIDGATVRTKFYDEFFLDATSAGITQAVILASGLDSRAYRLPWPAGTVVYELDQPQSSSSRPEHWPSWARRPPPTGEWSRSICATTGPPHCAPPDSTRPATAWSAEGLLGYLPPEAQDSLLDTITELSAPGSRVATESRPNPRPGDEDQTKEGLRRISERWRAHGFDLDHARLRYFGKRNEAAPT